jgi:hypothetical protein
MERHARTSIDEDTILERLVSGDVLTRDGSGFALSDAYLESTDRVRSRLEADSETARSYLEENIENDELVGASMDVCERDSTPVAGFLALQTHLDVPESNCVQLTPVLDQFLRGMPESEGAPDPFVPIRGDLLHLLIPILQRGVVYLWRYECEPCDLVKGDFEEYFETPPPDMALLSVYGPNWIDDIGAYEVGGAPTILFLRDGRIDARLVGAFPPKALVKEIEKIRELS